MIVLSVALAGPGRPRIEQEDGLEVRAQVGMEPGGRLGERTLPYTGGQGDSRRGDGDGPSWRIVADTGPKTPRTTRYLRTAPVGTISGELTEHRERAGVDVLHEGLALRELSGDRQSDERIGEDHTGGRVPAG
jgi:hypothetical protein